MSLWPSRAAAWPKGVPESSKFLAKEWRSVWGIFEISGTSQVLDSVTLAAAETKTISLRLMGPYSYPDKITIRVSVNGGPTQAVPISCD
jgi:hypothetical protein